MAMPQCSVDCFDRIRLTKSPDFRYSSASGAVEQWLVRRALNPQTRVQFPAALPFFMNFSAVGLTDRGYVRSRNEDCYFLSHHCGSLDLQPFFLVADGLGGLFSGDLASRVTIDTAVLVLDEHQLTPPQRLIEAYRQAHDAIQRLVSEKPLKGEMGTTLVSILFDQQQAWVANLGDSRIYRFRSNQWDQISHDHSWVQEMIDSGFLTAKQARFHPNRNLITKALGLGTFSPPDIFPLDAKNGDRFLLASDGLFGELTDARMAAMMAAPLALTAQNLRTAALAQGGSDNITLILIELVETSGPAEICEKRIERGYVEVTDSSS
jgi:serine/threonine protein phosphatase PrpC